MRCMLCLLLLVNLAPLASADDAAVARNKARALLMLEKHARQRETVFHDIGTARKVAAEMGRPLIIHVGTVSPEVVRTFALAVHVELDEWQSSKTPRLIMPSYQGYSWTVPSGDPDEQVRMIRQILTPRETTPQSSRVFAAAPVARC